MELNIDKTGWKKVKFGEVCRQVNETARNPQEEGLIHVVGLEHIGSNDLHIRSWNTLERETTFTRKFVKGQVLFGRRRAYQAKVAYAEFDGICSGDILVFEAIKSKLLPELLPFMVQSQKFYNKAVETSAGSLSPRTKFKDLADLEFLLPPKDQQARLAELLWAADEVVEREMEVKENVERYLSNSIGVLYNSNSNKFKTLGNLCKIHPSYGANASACEYKGGFRYVRITDIDDSGCLIKTDIKGVVFEDTDKYRLVDNDLLIARTAVPGKSFLYKDEYGDCVYAGYLIRFRLNTELVNPKYVFYYTFSDVYWKWIQSTIKVGTVANINAQEYASMKIPICSLEKQNEIISEIDSILALKNKAIGNWDLAQKLKVGLINEIF